MIDRRHFLAALPLLTAAARPLTASADVLPRMIDAHVHVFERNPRFPYAEGHAAPAEDATPEKLLQLMAANQVARTVLIQVIHYRWDNRYLLDVLHRYPGKFQGVCRVNPEDPEAPDHLSQHTAAGCHGIRLSPAATAEGDWIRGPLMKPLWQRCEQLKIPMTLLVPISRVPDLVPLIEAHPTLTVVIDHMADCPLNRPDQLQWLLDLARYPRVFVKISDLWSLSQQPYPFLDAQQMLRRIYDAFGPQRLMWASNWPVSLKQLSYGNIVALYRDHIPFINTQDRQQIFAETAARIWPFGL